MLRVYDISHWNNGVDWRLVKASGVAAAIIAGGDGAFLDPKFEANCEGACLLNPRRLDIYHYLRFWLDPESQADVCLKRIETARRINPNVRFFADWEDPSDQCAAMTVLQRQQWASEFLDSLENNGPPDLSYGHYTRASWFTPMLGTPGGKLRRQFFDHPLWVAHYGVPVPTVPQGWDKYGVIWLVWQYSSEGHVEGIPNAFTDLNWARPEFLGEEDGDMTEQQVKDIFASMMWPRFGPAYHTTRATAAALDGKGQEFKEQIELAIKSAKDWNLWPKEA